MFVLAPIGFLWNNLWSVSRYVMGPLSGRWRQSGNDQQGLAAPIWKYRSGFGDHRFAFFIDLRSNYTFYTNLTNIVHWVVAYRDVAHLVRLNLGKSWEKSAKSFDAGLTNLFLDKMIVILQTAFLNTFSWMKMFEIRLEFSLKFLPMGLIDNMAGLAHIMALRRWGDKPLFEAMLVCSSDALLRHSASMS